MIRYESNRTDTSDTLPAALIRYDTLLKSIRINKKIHLSGHDENILNEKADMLAKKAIES